MPQNRRQGSRYYVLTWRHHIIQKPKLSGGRQDFTSHYFINLFFLSSCDLRWQNRRGGRSEIIRLIQSHFYSQTACTTTRNIPILHRYDIHFKGQFIESFYIQMNKNNCNINDEVEGVTIQYHSGMCSDFLWFKFIFKLILILLFNIWKLFVMYTPYTLYKLFWTLLLLFRSELL